VEGSTVVGHIKEADGYNRKTVQKGYKSHLLGTIIYVLTMVTFFGWFALLSACTHLFNNTEDEQDMLMVYKTFAVVFMVGFFWTMSLYWPHSIKSLFFRQCLLSEATHVAIFHEIKEDNHDGGIKREQEERTGRTLCIATIMVIVNAFRACAHVYFSVIFADPHCHRDASKGLFEICPVKRNEDGSRYIVFLYRRYNYQNTLGNFEHGSWAMGTTFKDLSPRGVKAAAKNIKAADQAEEDTVVMDGPSGSFADLFGDSCCHLQGLTTQDVQERVSAVGPNVMEIPQPSFFKTLLAEISKPIYIYQVYIIWSWVLVDYFYATACIWFIIFMTAVLVSWFRYRGAQVLYAIARAPEEAATAIRNGALRFIEPRDLVPGDIVKIEAGKIHCDMILLTGECVLDESALTGEATPQVKVPIDPNSRDAYDPKVHKMMTLSAGTEVLECDDAFALVLKTASFTARGELIREVLIFRKHAVKFRTELPLVVGLLVSYSIIVSLIVFFSSIADNELVIAWLLAV
jgi:E1-E2 ATPase/Cation transporter/ATPase, N-terminus